jgi:hypothetical protein
LLLLLRIGVNRRRPKCRSAGAIGFSAHRRARPQSAV